MKVLFREIEQRKVQSSVFIAFLKEEKILRSWKLFKTTNLILRRKIWVITKKEKCE